MNLEDTVTISPNVNAKISYNSGLIKYLPIALKLLGPSHIKSHSKPVLLGATNLFD